MKYGAFSLDRRWRRVMVAFAVVLLVGAAPAASAPMVEPRGDASRGHENEHHREGERDRFRGHERPRFYAAPGPYYLAPPYWYYCDSEETYYPYVTECPEGWRPVVPGD